MNQYRRVPDVALRQRINRLAHAEAARHELRVRADMLARCQALLDEGATIAQVHAMVDERERAARQALPA